MIRSLRLRFLLVTWPVVVLAVVGMAVAFDRWTRLELVDVEADAPPADLVAAAEDVAAVVHAGRDAAGAIQPAARATLEAAAAAAGVTFVAVDRTGAILAATDPTVAVAAGGEAFRPGGPHTFERHVRTDEGVTRQAAQLSGWATPDGAVTVFALPDASPVAVADAAELRADARRTVWWSVLVASLAAALLTALLAEPLVRQLRGLAAAARRLGGGDLSVRVPGRGHDELGQLERSFNGMAADLERAEARQRRLVSDVAHELRTPLTNMRGLLEAIEDGLRPADAATLGVLAGETRLLGALVEDLQELTLVESGQAHFERAPVDVGQVCAAAVGACQPAAGPDVRFVGGQGPAVVLGDGRRLAQVLRNLLSNAIRHSPPDGAVEVEVQARAAEVEILVRDGGEGIPADQLPLVWERFHRVDGARGRERGGRGLGLAIVKGIVERMGGRVGATSVPGGGATFRIVLPRADP